MSYNESPEEYDPTGSDSERPSSLAQVEGSTLRFPPPEPRKFSCPIGCTPTNGCPNMECTSETIHGERYRCDHCGESYYIDYDDIR